ncbi:hypothetical protein EsDP_00005409 [Epichloe bromicola]|uniref:PinX1-related protein 1 n=1 Tax=Epichloe bromicola TaxID=79588 RepID=A0ABQ0CUK1_9HYPO
MGLLAENKSRSKINKDPNNTKWTRDTTTFGQKMLRAQGWQPGQFLGVQDAAHSELHTAANASYIRVVLKDDMKGLGFNKAKENEVTGLDVFSDLLSRLNGKSADSIEGDQQARMVFKTHRYVEAKWGPMRFVRGGLLIGDEMKEEPQSTESTPASDAEVQDADTAADEKPKKSKKDKKSKKSKKRKAADLKDSEIEPSEDAKKQEKRRRREERRAKKLAVSSEVEAPDEDDTRTKRKSKKDKAKSRTSTSSEAEDEQIDAKKSKGDKKEKKRRKKEDAADAETTTTTVSSSATTTGTSTPTKTWGLVPGSRNFVRSRFIAQKRQAVLDTKALAQIFMVKT